jgi:anti-sigma regulatory factor (Ser/Thr protein kinase)
LKSQAVTYPRASLPSSELRLPAELSQLAAARTFARQAAAAYGFDGDGCYEFAYAVNEAVTNAIRHGRPDERGFIRVTISAEADRLTCAVRDCGTFIPPAEGPAACCDMAAEHGRGLALMRILMDEVRVHTFSGGTIVCLSKVRS